VPDPKAGEDATNGEEKEKEVLEETVEAKLGATLPTQPPSRLR